MATTAQLKENMVQEDEVRIGPISLFALITVICLAVLAVLAFSTANATLLMTQRQATATTELYLDETAAQEFMADVSDTMAAVRQSGGTGADAANAVQASLIELCQDVNETSGGRVSATASLADMKLYAQFTCENGRELNIVATIRDNATYRIDKWKMTAVQNEEEPAGNLWTGD